MPALTAIDPPHLRPAAGRCGEGLGVAVQAEARPDLANVQDGAHRRNPHPEIIVHGEVVAGIKRPHHAPETRAEEGRLLWDVHVTPSQTAQVCLCSGKTTYGCAALVYVVGLAIDHAHFRTLCQRLDSSRDCARAVDVVRIEPCQNLAAGAGEAPVDRICLPGIRLRAPEGQAVLVAANDFKAAIRRTAVDDDVLQVRVVLGKDRLDRSGQERRLVERRGDNGY
jgi:hypothetical protein